MKPTPIDGHPEMGKYSQKMYFYLDGKKPSGLKGTKMVTGQEQALLGDFLSQIKRDGLHYS
jgi:hypothetical protein